MALCTSCLLNISLLFFCSSFVMTYCSELRSVREFCRRREGRGGCSETWFRLSIDSLQHRVVTGNRYDHLALFFSFPYCKTFFFLHIPATMCAAHTGNFARLFHLCRHLIVSLTLFFILFLECLPVIQRC